HIQQQVSATRKQQTVEESHQAVSDQSQAVPTSQGQLMPGNSMRQPMQNPQAQQSMHYMGNSNAAMQMQAMQMQAMQAMALERNIDLSLPQNAHMMAQL
ncbi:hypothetical protein Tco_0560035, partial [Tanacetum coccineum]